MEKYTLGREEIVFEDDQMCFVCGARNRAGFRLSFHPEPDGSLWTECVAPKKFQGFKNILHGGILATLLDEVMVNVVYLRGTVAVTAEMTVRLKRPVLVGERLRIVGRVQRESRRTVEVASEARISSGVLVAEATALLVKKGVARPV